jgi:hypothetical protein
MLERGGHAMGEVVLAQVAVAWGQRLRRWVHVCAGVGVDA